MTNYFENAKTKDEIKAKYKELAKKYHPDVYGEAGNEILKEVHNQLEKAIKNADKDYFKIEDYKETNDIRAKKEELVKEALNYPFPEGALLALYWENRLKPCNHKNPLSKHNFSGWNIWSLEISMVLNGYYSSNWSTFAQYRDAKNFVAKGQKGTHLTLAVYKKEKDEKGEEIDKFIYYTGYKVFNYEQTKAVSSINEAKKITVIPQFRLSVAG